MTKFKAHLAHSRDSCPGLLSLCWAQVKIVYVVAQMYTCTVKPVLSDHSKIDIMKVLKTGGSLMQV